MSAHDFTFTALDGGELDLATFRGRAVLLANTASACGFAGQLGGLTQLYADYGARGLMPVAVPSNDFGDQEPLDETAIARHYREGYGVDFPITGKTHVVGEAAHPFFRWIADEVGEAALPQWNFQKYLIAPDGELVGAWPAKVAPADPEIVEAIEAVLPR